MTDAEMIDCPDDRRQLERLRAIMHRLRAPGGCPWDAEQTHESLVSNMIEEAYEAVEAIQSGDQKHLCEELGDVLLQVVFHAELAEEAGHFNLDGIARGISDKLVRRHPHVFASSEARDSPSVLQQWDAIKRMEKGNIHEEAFLDGVGKGLPALPRAAKLQKKAAKVGFDWPDADGVMDKIKEELEEVREARKEGNRAEVAEELGDLLFSVVNLVRFHGEDPEILMGRANRKFEDRFHAMERILKKRNLGLKEASASQMEEAWLQAKLQETGSSIR